MNPRTVRTRTAWLLLSCLAGLPACAASLEVQRIRVGTTGPLAGLVVNHNVPYQLVSVFRDAPGSEHLTSCTSEAMLPSREELYVIGYHGALFSTRELKVELNPDTTLKRVRISSESQSGKSSDSLSSAGGTIASAAQSVLAIRAAQPTATGAENQALQEQVLNLMLKANKNAIDKGQPLPYPALVAPGTVPPPSP